MTRWITGILAAIVLTGCATFSTKMFRVEKLAVDSAYGAVKAFNAYYNNLDPINKERMAQTRVKFYDATKRFAAAAKATELLRQEYQKNTTEENKQALIAAVDALSNQSSNIVWTVKYIKETQ